MTKEQRQELEDIETALKTLDAYCNEFIKADSGNLVFDIDGFEKINQIIDEQQLAKPNKKP